MTEPVTQYRLDILQRFKVADPPEPRVFGGEGNGGFSGNGTSRELINPVVGSWPQGLPGGSMNGFVKCMANTDFDDTLKTERV